MAGRSLRTFAIPAGLGALSTLGCLTGEHDDELGYGCVIVDAGSSCPTERPTWVDVHSLNSFLFGGYTYGYYGYYGYTSEPGESEEPKDCGTSVGQSWDTGFRYCSNTGIEYIGRDRPASATEGCPIPTDADLCCYEFSCET